MPSRLGGGCSHFAPTRRPSDAHRDEAAGRWRSLISEDQLIELPRLRLMHLGHEMAVAIERCLNGGMAKLRLDVLRVGTLGDQQTRVGMAEIVETHPAEASSPERLGKLPVTEVICIEGRASVTTEDKL